jgi:hypothetical protein
MKIFIKILHPIIGVVCFITLLMSCKSHQYTFKKMPTTQLIFGSGGGFTGMITEYLLLENGQFFQVDTYTQEKIEIKHARKSRTEKMFNALDKIDILKVECNMPGNIYYFIRYKTDAIDHCLTWGDPAANIDEAIKKYHADLMQLADDCKDCKEPAPKVRAKAKDTTKLTKTKKNASDITDDNKDEDRENRD